ncbi:MAG: adenylate kinase [marine benthic group bacterium]|nr:adenylate kinase [Candidatus Carthagonibacter metallireducens]MCL7967241.1 adenylate kinase [Gemmatimonadota bacterium]MCL7979584.1 adenylate kinase [Gemmatimonadota bacterium]MCL7985303.1 adenylate kinase [Gemmatimonadota bacterium]
MRIVLMGPPGAGKGTQGEILERRYDVPRFSTGDILRTARREGTEMGRRAQQYMDAGELVPDEVILGIMGEALAGEAARNGFILDGFPRTVAQAEGLARMLDELGINLDAVINISVEDDEIVRRLSGRRVCSKCGVVVGPDAKPDATCGECGGALIQRRDDDAATVRRRLEVYREQTEPVLAWYRASGPSVVDVDGLGSVEGITKRVQDGIAA